MKAAAKKETAQVPIEEQYPEQWEKAQEIVEKAFEDAKKKVSTQKMASFTSGVYHQAKWNCNAAGLHWDICSKAGRLGYAKAQAYKADVD